MKYIDTSIFDLFKIGPGPSSSHTIGPMKAAHDFLCSINNTSNNNFKQADRIDVFLYGSLSSTGKGHGTDRSITAGLLGNIPEDCDPDFLSALLSPAGKVYKVNACGREIAFCAKNIFFETESHSFPYQNTLIIHLFAGKKLLFEKEYYSIGGGFIKIKGEKESICPAPVYKYGNIAELKKQLEKHNMGLTQLVIENEQAISGIDSKAIFKKLRDIIDIMEHSVAGGLTIDGELPGPIKLQRKAHSLYEKVSASEHIPDQFLIYLNAYALAASEENAAGRRVVTAPTSGSAGVLPGIIYLMHKHFHVSKQKLCEGMLAAAVIGCVARHNASISGAEVGCQGEIGVASSMAAAFLAHLNGYPIEVIENAAEIALEHQLGMTCDPVGGYVQIPCIERNAVGAVNAYNAYLLASSGDPEKQKLNFDEVIEAMLETGRDMSTRYKETSKGGLAVCSISC
jgi:L-serine dehydratase